MRPKRAREACQLSNKSKFHPTTQADQSAGCPPTPGQLNNEITELATELAHAEREIHRLRFRVDELKQTFSYRIAAPIRFVERGFRSWRRRSLLANIRKMMQAKRRPGPADWRMASPPHRGRYGEWIAAYDTPSDAVREFIRNDIARWPRRPLVSILIDARQCQDPELTPTIQSLSEQLYSESEIVVACRDEPQVQMFKATFNKLPISDRLRWVVSDVNQIASVVARRLVTDAKGELGLCARPGICFSPSGL
jgi:hypothetical protein